MIPYVKENYSEKKILEGKAILTKFGSHQGNYSCFLVVVLSFYAILISS
jgi:hypothetical protein